MYKFKTEKEYEATCVLLEALCDGPEKELSDEEVTCFKELARITEEYEDEHWPIPDVTPGDLIEYLVEAQEVDKESLVEQLGTKERLQEVLQGKPITKEEAQLLAERFNTDVALFLK